MNSWLSFCLSLLRAGITGASQHPCLALESGTLTSAVSSCSALKEPTVQRKKPGLLPVCKGDWGEGCYLCNLVPGACTLVWACFMEEGSYLSMSDFLAAASEGGLQFFSVAACCSDHAHRRFCRPHCLRGGRALFPLFYYFYLFFACVYACTCVCLCGGWG